VVSVEVILEARKIYLVDSRIVGCLVQQDKEGDDMERIIEIGVESMKETIVGMFKFIMMMILGSFR
jgi:hypothetical protein